MPAAPGEPTPRRGTDRARQVPTGSKVNEGPGAAGGIAPAVRGVIGRRDRFVRRDRGHPVELEYMEQVRTTIAAPSQGVEHPPAGRSNEQIKP